MLILASTSPRRRKLMALLLHEYRAISAEIDETPRAGEFAEAYVLRLANEKSASILSRVAEGDVILAADTTVVYQGKILGKPDDSHAAFQMLSSLRGETHQVLTGLSLLKKQSKPEIHTTLCVTGVTMRRYSDTEIEAYIQTGDPLDKAGAYAIQHSQFNPVESIQGCYANVVGLPLCKAAYLLSQAGFEIHNSQIVSCLENPENPCQMKNTVQALFE